MKKFSKKFVAMTIAAVLCLGSLTACGEDKTDDSTEAETTAEATEEETTEAEATTQEVSFDTGNWKVTAQAPEGSSYVFSENQPDTLIASGEFYLDSPKLVGSFGTKTVFGDDKTFDGMINFITADDYTGTIKEFEQIKIGDRDAIKFEYRYGNGSGEHYGYWYYVDFPELYEGCMVEMVLCAADGKPESTESTFADEEVQAFIDSLRFDLSTGDTASTDDAGEEEEPEEAATPENGGELSDGGVTLVVNSDTSKGTWYVKPTSFTVYYYNVASEDDAYSNSPRIQVSLQTQSRIDADAEYMENVTDVDGITIDGIDFKGRTYTMYGMEWTEYTGTASGEELIRIEISDVDTADGTDGANVLNNMTFEVK